MNAESLQKSVEILIGVEPFNLTAEDSSDGFIITNWYYHNGPKAGSLWWKKTLLERTRYYFRIYPDFRKTNDASILELRWKTEQRPNEKYSWKEVISDHGANTASELFFIISTKIHSNDPEERKINLKQMLFQLESNKN